MSKKESLSRYLIDEYISSNRENSTVIDYHELQDKGIKTYYYDELNNTITKGYPFASDLYCEENGECYSTSDARKMDADWIRSHCRLRFHYMPYYHELYLGSTGSGKTTGCIEPQIRAITSQKNKPNVFISDPKGELYEHNVAHLIKNGYNVHIVNFKDTTRSDRWNPLTECYRQMMSIRDVDKLVKHMKGLPKEKARISGKRSEFNEENGYYVFKNICYPNRDSVNKMVEFEKYMIQSKVFSELAQIAYTMLPEKSQKDPTWEMGARRLLLGILETMMLEGLQKPNEFTEDMCTIKSVFDCFTLMVRSSNRDSNEDDGTLARRERLLANKPKETVDKIMGVLTTADSTKKGYFSVFESSLADWLQGHVFQLTSGTTFNIDDDSAHPFAIFFATRDYTKSDYGIASLFVDWVYRKMLIKADLSPKDENNNPNTRVTHFILDEFGNIPKIPDFENKIATARSRNIYFHIFLQSYDQLDVVYGHQTGNIIVDNCNQQSYLGSQHSETKKRFSEQCGIKTVSSISSVLKEGGVNLEQVPVVTISDLDLIEPGEIYSKRIYTPVVLSSYIRSYIAAELKYFADFRVPDVFEEYAPVNNVICNDDEHTYSGFSTMKKIYREKRF